MAPRVQLHRDMNSEVSTLLDDLVYARVLMTLQIQLLEAKDHILENRLRRTLEQLPGTEDERLAACEEALARAWERATGTVVLVDDEQSEPLAA